MKKNDNEDFLDLIFLGLFSIASFIIIGACVKSEHLSLEPSKAVLQQRLQKALDDQKYELAAKLRDQIRDREAH